VEFDTVIAGTGLLSVLPRIQRIRMGPQHAGQLAHVWADEHSVHILIGGTLAKTAASNLAPADLGELRLRGARPAGPPPAAAAARNRGFPPARSSRWTARPTAASTSCSAAPGLPWG
jgi:hypothetical protein